MFDAAIILKVTLIIYSRFVVASLQPSTEEAFDKSAARNYLHWSCFDVSRDGQTGDRRLLCHSTA